MSPSAPPPPAILDPRPSSPSGGSRWKGAVVGAAVGLAFVGAVVVGSRYAAAHRAAAAGGVAPVLGTTEPATPALESPVTPQLPTAAPQPAAPQQGQPSSLVPVVSASDLPHARPVGHGRLKARATAPAASTAAEAATAPAATAPADTAAAPEDSAAALVPVIPSATPPPADPFVKAVQDDIEGK